MNNNIEVNIIVKTKNGIKIVTLKNRVRTAQKLKYINILKRK